MRAESHPTFWADATWSGCSYSFPASPSTAPSFMQMKFYFDYLYGPCCWEMDSLFWIWWKFLVVLENSASWNIPSLCVQQTAFSISSVKSSWLQQMLQEPTHSCKWGMTQIGILQIGNADFRTRNKTEGFMKWVLLQVLQSGHHLSTLWCYMAIIHAICEGRLCEQYSSFIRQLLFLVQALGFPVGSMKTTLFWKKFCSNIFEVFWT